MCQENWVSEKGLKEELICNYIFAEKYLLTNSDKIKKLASKYDFKVTSQLPEDKSPKMLISGKAIFLTRETLVDAVSAYVGGIFYQ